MTWRTASVDNRLAVWPFSRRAARALTMIVVGIALLIAACGTSGNAGITPTPTTAATPSPTATPLTCTTWRLIASPSPVPHSYLRAVSALSPTAAWAVGGSGVVMFDPVIRTFAEQWDGTAWRVTPTPGQYPLNSVAAVSLTDVWAVGGVQPNPQFKHPVTLILHWNGTAWTQVPSPNPSPMQGNLSGNSLTAVVARAAADVWAVGSYTTASDGMQTLTLHWNGTMWQVIPSPTLGNDAGAFNAAAVVPGTNQLWAVGYRFTRTPPYPMQTLIERWDGTAWQVVANPVLPSNYSEIQLTGVTALSATDAWAVGRLVAATDSPLIMHWNGTVWKIVSSPHAVGELSSVAATGPDEAQAVGFSMPNGDWNQYQPETWLVERWNGTAWQIEKTPTPTWLYTGDVPGVAADSAGDFWAVGTYLIPPDAYPPDSDRHTLTEHCAS